MCSAEETARAGAPRWVSRLVNRVGQRRGLKNSQGSGRGGRALTVINLRCKCKGSIVCLQATKIMRFSIFGSNEA